MRYFDNSPFQTNKIKDLFISSDKRNTNNSDEYLSVVRDVGVIKYSERGDSGNKTSDIPEKYRSSYIISKILLKANKPVPNPIKPCPKNLNRLKDLNLLILFLSSLL